MNITYETIRKDRLNRNFRNVALAEEVFIDIASDEKTNTSGNYEDVEAGDRLIDFNKYIGYEMFLEVHGKVTAGTGYWKLVNVTDSEDIVGSEINTTSSSIVRVRSTAITKPLEGQKVIKLQHKGGNITTVEGKIIFII